MFVITTNKPRPLASSMQECLIHCLGCIKFEYARCCKCNTALNLEEVE